MLFDTNGAILQVNASACHYFDCSEQEFLTRRIYSFLKFEDACRVHDVLQRLDEGDTGTLAIEVLSPNDIVLTCDFVYHALNVEDKLVVFVRCHDLQVMSYLNRTLEEKEVFYRGAERLAKLGSWAYYPAEDRIVWSEEIFRIFGLPIHSKPPTFEEYVAKVYPEDVASFVQVVQGAMAQGEGYTIKHRILRPDGSVRWVIGRGDVFMDEFGAMEKLFGTVQDVTDEEEIRRSIQRSEQRIRFHIDRSPLGYVEWNTRFEVMEWNKAAEDIFGFTYEEAIKGEAQIIPDDLQEEIGPVVQNLLNGTGGTHSINENLTKSGDRITCEWFNTTLKDEAGEIIGIGSIILDITEREKAKEQLEDYAKALEIAKDLAESAAKAKSNFLANMSHEIRTPMNGVIGMASLLLGTDLDEEQRDNVETIVSSGESLLSIINDILDFSKIEAGKIDIERYAYSVRTVLENTLDLLSAKAAEKDLELIYMIADEVPHSVIGDPTRLQQILLNLLGNGIKFTDDGYVEVLVDVVEAEDDSLMLEFQVTDTGIGIPAEKQDRLFKAFSQLDASTTRKYGGTGLGLSISARLTQLMGGQISVDSTEGQGTRFTFSITVGVDDNQPDKADVHLEGLHLLVAEPNGKMQAMLAGYLERMHASVVFVASEREVFDCLEQQRFDVVLLEDTIQEKKGVEVARGIQERIQTDRPAVVLLSRIIDRTHSEAIQARISKPIHFRSLYNTIHKLTVLQK